MSPAVLAAALLATAAAPDVSVETLRTIADRFDQAQIAQDRATMEAMTAPDLVFVGSNGVRQSRADFIAGWMDPSTHYEPITITDRYFLPLGPDAGVVGGDVVVRGTSGGAPFAVRIRFSDTFRRFGGEWRAVHIQATRVPEPPTQ
ncbi:MAG TPA: nuclear transport factor 2 family protein [Allosphingosinicella sp.]|nr:nuclear transport factor 2 family protein [Allosphingosinicella sp.]